MSTSPPSPAGMTPDRQFARACAIMLCAGLAMLVASFIEVERSARRQALMADLALAAAAEAASAQSMVAALDMLAERPDAPDAPMQQTRLAWDTEQLLGQERDRLARAGVEGETSTLVEIAGEAAALSQSPRVDAREAARVAAALEARILPRLNLIASRHRAATEAAATRTRSTILVATALQLLGGVALVGMVLRPARRRIAEWVARSRETDRENRFRLLHDSLTGLPNATYLHAFLARIAAGSERSATQTAVLRVDLDRFGILRETLGQRDCDEIIRLTARRIRQAMRGGDFAAYVGQDNFVVVALDLEDANAAAPIAARIQAALRQPFSIRGGARHISCSIGVTLLSDDQPDPDRILANARIALGEAQGVGTGNVRYFRDGLRTAVERRETLYTELLAAIDTGELIPFFQPQIALETRAFAGFESLIRWQHPRHGLLMPSAFLDFAEETDLTERIGEMILTRSLDAIQAWDAAGLVVPKVGVNFALAQLRDPRLIEKIKWETERFDIDPARLSIEVLETVLIKSDADLVVRNLRGLASSGFSIELDD
ncbi:EAL domain-containing protein, partial [Amaricoccus sp.]|uniref:EAL domain-containing protein n=3 Tax=Amaricoccus sp. TaxID=1872485 RepID=UPI002CB790E0